MAPSLDIPTAPTGAIYTRLIEMSKLLASKLPDEGGLAARDLINVYDFVDATPRAKAVKEITAAMESTADNSPDTESAAA